MASILFAWELGGGYGHATQIASLVPKLRMSGHQIFVAVRELPNAAGLNELNGVMLLQSPFARPPANPPIAAPRTYADILYNAGYDDPAKIQLLLDKWGHLIDSVMPDVMVFDHAPTALLASRARTMKRVLLGTGFCCPADCSPLPDLRPWMPPDADRLLQTEQYVLDCMNQVLERDGVEPLSRLTQLFKQVDDTFLRTLAEFDHYPMREDARYRGPWSSSGGKPPAWPEGNGKRIYAYLSPFPWLRKILNSIRASGNPTIIYGTIDVKLQLEYASPHIRFETDLLNLRQASAECDIAILNGGHATTIAFLLAGKPALFVPKFLEQALNAMNAIRLGAGLMAFPKGIDRTIEQIDDLLYSPHFTDSARAFSAKYANFSAEIEIAQAVERLDELVNN